MSSRVNHLWLALLLLTVAAGADAPVKNEPPRIVMSVPLGVATGTTKIVLRGWRLDDVTDVRVSVEQATAKILSKGKASIPNQQEAKHIGDTQLEVELTLPLGTPIQQAQLVAVRPDGESKPYDLFVGGPVTLVAEREPNDGFRQAQPISLPQVVDGQIHGDRNVDVFAFEATAGQTLTVEVFAARRGSAVDSLLTLYDAAGNILVANDDLPDTSDSRIETQLPRSGKYFLSLLDAHDQGGPAHPYRLVFGVR